MKRSRTQALRRATALLTLSVMLVTQSSAFAQSLVYRQYVPGLQANPVLAVNPSTVTFTAANTGTDAPGQSVTIANISQSSAQVTDVVAEAPFSVASHNCNFLPPGAACQAQLGFHPTVAGLVQGTLVVSHDSNRTATATLHGEGIGVAAFTASTSALAFGEVLQGTSSAPQYVTIYNTGTGATSIAEVQVSSPYSATHNCGELAAYSGSCQVEVRFHPPALGSFPGTLRVTGGNGTYADVQLSGNGTGQAFLDVPASLAFGNVAVGTPATLPLALANSGQINLTVSAATLSGPGAAHFSVASGTCGAAFPVTVVPGGSCNLQVTYTAHTHAVTDAATLTLTSNSANGAAAVALSATGASPSASLSIQAPVGYTAGSFSYSTVRVTNTGAGPITFTSAARASGSGDVWYPTSGGSANGWCMTNLALQPGQYCHLSYGFWDNVADNTTLSGTVSVTTTAGTQTASISGTIRSITTTVNVSNPSVVAGATQDVVVTFRNNSAGNFYFNNSSPIPNDPQTGLQGWLFQGSTCPTSSPLAPGATCTATYRLTSTAGTSGATAIPNVRARGGFDHLTPTGSGGPRTTAHTDTATFAPINVTATVVRPQLTALPGWTNWGTVGAASDTGDWVWYRNDSSINLVIQGHAIASGPSGFWAWAPTGGSAGSYCSVGVVLAPGQACYYFVGMGALATPGSYTGVNRVYYSAQAVPGYNYTVDQSYSFAVGTSSGNTSVFAYGNQDVNTTSSGRTVTITNYANYPLQNISVSIEGGNAGNFSVAGSNCGTQLAAGAQCFVTVTFTPTWAANGFSSTLYVRGQYARYTAGPANSGYYPSTITAAQVALSGNGRLW